MLNGVSEDAMPEHVAVNRTHWDARSPQWIAPAERNWEAAEPDWRRRSRRCGSFPRT